MAQLKADSLATTFSLAENNEKNEKQPVTDSMRLDFLFARELYNCLKGYKESLAKKSFNNSPEDVRSSTLCEEFGAGLPGKWNRDRAIKEWMTVDQMTSALVRQAFTHLTNADYAMKIR